MLRILDYVVEAAHVSRLLAKERGIFLEGLVFVIQFLLYGIVPRVVGVKHHVVVRGGHVGHCHGVGSVRIHLLIAH